MFEAERGRARLDIIFGPACKIAFDVIWPASRTPLVFRSSAHTLVLSRRRALDIPYVQQRPSDRPLLHDGAALHRGDDRQFSHRVYEGGFQSDCIDTAAVLAGRIAFG